MQITEVTSVAFFWAFIAGLVSFLSPCVLPLLPGYLSYVSGVGVDQLGARTRKVGLASFAFVVGFAVLFSIQGAVAGGVGESLSKFVNPVGEGRRPLEIVAGVFLIVFGLFALGVFRPAWFERERRVRMLKKPASLVGVMIAGMLFSIGIGPCTGPLLGSVYMLAASSQDPVGGASLLFVYAVGMGVPFVLSGFLFARMIGTFSFVKRHFNALKIISGSLLIIFGLLMATGQLEALTVWLQKVMPNVEL